MVLLEVTSRIDDALKVYGELENNSEPSKELLNEDNKVNEKKSYSITHTQLCNISKRLISTYPEEPKYRLAELMRGTSVHIPPKPIPPPKSKEFLEQMERLRNEQAEREYQSMINPEMMSTLSSNSQSIPTFGQETKQVREQLSAIVNIMVSVGSVAFAIWYWSGSSAGYSIPTRTLLSVFGALVVLIAEVVVYLRYKFRIEEAKEVERKKKETKTVISQIKIGSDRVDKVDLLENTTSSVDSIKSVRRRGNRKPKKL